MPRKQNTETTPANPSDLDRLEIARHQLQRMIAEAAIRIVSEHDLINAVRERPNLLPDLITALVRELVEAGVPTSSIVATFLSLIDFHDKAKAIRAGAAS